MVNGTIIRGTTPSHEFELPCAVEDIKQLEITYGQKGKPLFTKYKENCYFEDNLVSVTLTQEETFSFIPGNLVLIEIRILSSGDTVIRSEEPVVLRVVDNMSREVLR